MSDIKGFSCMAKINQDSPIYKGKLERQQRNIFVFSIFFMYYKDSYFYKASQW